MQDYDIAAEHMSTWYAWFLGAGIVVLGLFCFVFAQFTMRRIDKEFKAAGIKNPCIWNALGAPIFNYAFAIVFPLKLALRLRPLMDVELIRSYANHADWWRGILFLVTTYTWLTVLLLGGFLGAAG